LRDASRLGAHYDEDTLVLLDEHQRQIGRFRANR